MSQALKLDGSALEVVNLKNVKQVVDPLHGSPTVVKGSTDRGVIGIYVNNRLTDESVGKSAIVLYSKQDSLHFCKNETVETQPTVVSGKSTNVYSLIDRGVTRRPEDGIKVEYSSQDLWNSWPKSRK